MLGIDVDGDDLKYEIVSTPRHCNLSPIGPVQRALDVALAE